MSESQPGSIKRLWTFLLQPSAKYSVLTLLVVGAIGGVIFWGGFNTGMEATNTLAFCTSCHEMRDTVYQEYQETIHYKNRTGVRAICSDCHVPKDWTHKLIRKIKASAELYGKITGSIDTKEKFEAKRFELAKNEWAQMKASGSRECRNCHNFDAMEKDRQRPRAQAAHAKAQQEGKTCIDCHKGIAHLLPKEYNEDEQ
jgi:cytochrome c-type protein NapC